MKHFLAKLSSPAGMRTVGSCLCIEALVLVLLYALTGSFAASAIISIVGLGPLSLFLAAPMYRHFSQPR